MSDRRSDNAPAGTAAATEKPRLLIHVPIVHSGADMGSSSDAVRQAYIDQKGLKAWQESRRVIGRFWRDLEKKIALLDLDFGRLRLYQDGLPVCGHETDIVRDMAETAGANYQILLDLMAQGATLEGTENPELLLKEYRLWKAATAGPATDRQSADAADSAAQRLLEERDRYIAQRIDATLQPGEIGMLFLGALHNVTGMLPTTIEVKSLDEVIGAEFQPAKSGNF